MDVSRMVEMLSYRVGDTNKRLFTDSFLLKTLNKAQVQATQLLNNLYLTELEVLETGKSLSSGALALSGLSNAVLGGEEGILQVKINGGAYCTRISEKYLKDYENYYKVASTDNPYYYVFANKIYVLPATVSKIDVYYLRMPTDLIYRLNADQADSGASKSKFDGRSTDGLSASDDAYNNAPIFHDQKDEFHVVTDYVGADLEFTVTPAGSENFSENQEFYFILNDFDTLSRDNFAGMICDLNPALHEIVISLAEAICWTMDGKADRRQAALDMATMEIEMLNAMVEMAEGIGIHNVRGN